MLLLFERKVELIQKIQFITIFPFNCQQAYREKFHTGWKLLKKDRSTFLSILQTMERVKMPTRMFAICTHVSSTVKLKFIPIFFL